MASCDHCGHNPGPQTAAFSLRARSVSHLFGQDRYGLLTKRSEPARTGARALTELLGRAPDPECVPIEIIQQESDLTRDASPGCSREVYRPE